MAIDKPPPPEPEKTAGRRRVVAAPASPTAASAEAALPRLSKVMAARGLCSRREADALIEKGLVKVNGVICQTLGLRIEQQAQIEILAAGQRLQASKVTILINKPIGYVSGQAEDGYQPAVCLVLPENQYYPKGGDETQFSRHMLRGLAPAGRLDIDSTGLLVLTQDGRVARQLINDDSRIDKEYLVRVEGEMNDAGLALLRHGLSLDGKVLRPALVEWQNDNQLKFVLREGRKRQIRRMCEAVGLTVVGLKRVRIGRIRLGDLPIGQWRFLSKSEAF